MMVATTIRESDEVLDSASDDRSSHGSSESQGQKSVPSTSDLDSTTDVVIKDSEQNIDDVDAKKVRNFS